MAAVAVARVGIALLSGDVRRLALGAIGALFLGSASIVFIVVMLLKSLLGFAGGSAGLGLLPGVGGAAGPLASAIAGDQLAFMQQVAAASACGLPWSVLAGVAFVESDFGTNLGPSSAGAYGYAQFMPGVTGNGPWASGQDGHAPPPHVAQRWVRYRRGAVRDRSRLHPLLLGVTGNGPWASAGAVLGNTHRRAPDPIRDRSRLHPAAMGGRQSFG